MGYAVRLVDGVFRIEGRHFPAIVDDLLALVAYDDDTPQKMARQILKDPGIVESAKIPKALEALFGLARLAFKFGTNRASIVALTRDASKTDGLEDVLVTLAPYVGSGCWLEFRGEDSASWRYLFRAGEIARTEPKVVWPKDFKATERLNTPEEVRRARSKRLRP